MKRFIQALGMLVLGAVLATGAFAQKPEKTKIIIAVGGKKGTYILFNRGPVSREQAAKNRAQSHHFKIIAIHHTSADLARLTQPDDGEVEGRKRAEFLDALQPAAYVIDFRDGEIGIVRADSRSTLAHVEQAIFVAIGQRPQQHATNYAEDRRVRADAQSQSDGYGEPQRTRSRQ